MRSKLLLGLALGFAGPLAAAGPLSWPQAVSEAAQANPDLLTAAESLRQAHLAVALAYPAFLPTLSANASLGQSGPYTGDGIPGTFGDPSNSSSAGLSANWSIFNGFRDVAALGRAQAQLSSAVAGVQATRAKLAYDLRAAFIALLQAQENLTQSQDIAKRRAGNADLVSLNYQSGSDNKGSLLQTQALAAQADYQAKRAERTLRESAANLCRLLGREAAEDLRVEGILEAPPLPAVPELKALQAGLPSVVQAEAAVESARQDLSTAHAAWWPSLNASAGLNRSGSDWLSEKGSWNMGLSASLPLFQGGQRVLNQLAADSRLTAARFGLASARELASVTLRNSWDGFEDAVQSSSVQSQFLAAADVRADVARAQYTQGLINFDTWDRIETDLINAQIQALSSRGDAQRAAAAWERDLGRSPW